MSEHELWNELGNLYFMAGAYDQAVHAYHRSIHIDESYGRPYSNLALIYAQQGKHELAGRLFRQSLELLTDTREKAISWNRLGNLHRQARNYAEAVVAFQRADELDPECREGREEMGQMLYATSDLSIIERAQQLKDSDPEFAELPAARELAPAPERESVPRGRTASDAQAEWVEEESEGDWLTPWVELGSDDSSADAQSAEPEISIPALDFEPDVEEAEEYVIPDRYPLAIALPNPRAASAAQAPARSKEQLVDVDLLERPETDDQAAPAAEEARAEQPPQVLAPQPAVAESTDDAELEFAKLQRMVQINPRNASAWDSLGNLHKGMGRYQDALMAYQQAVSIDPQRADYHHHLGLVHAILGQNEEAIMSFQKVLELAPDHSLAHATLGGYYRKMGLDELAQKHIGKAMRNIYDSESEYNRACFEAIRGNVDQAIELLRIALENRQTYAEWVIHDPDLDFIREDPRFRKLVSEYAR
jgi:tetratricopeptide (TPR) repeat protein